MTGAVNRDFWTCGSFADFVAGAALGDEPRSADSVAGAGTALGEPRFGAGTALCEPRSADFVASTALCEP